MGTIENLMGTPPKTNLLLLHSQEEISLASHLVLFFPSSVSTFSCRICSRFGDECISCKNKMHVIKAQLGALQIQQIL